MTLGFRYWMGIGVKEDCMRALDWYESVAHKCRSGQWSYIELRGKVVLITDFAVIM